MLVVFFRREEDQSVAARLEKVLKGLKYFFFKKMYAFSDSAPLTEQLIVFLCQGTERQGRGSWNRVA